MDNLLVILSWLVLAGCWGAPLAGIVLPVWLNLVLTASTVVFIGAHRSLLLLVSEKDGGAPAAKKEMMTTKDVMQFPVVGSCALFGLFVAFKYYREYATVILSLYFALAAVFTLTNTLAPLVATVFPSPKKYGFKRTFPLIGEVDAEFTIAELISLVPSTIFALIHFKHKGFMMNNVIGISFCVQAIESLSLGNYRNGAILLLGLFFYDIFWVFYSEGVFGDNVMVSVAQNLDEPIKLLFPMSLPGNGTTVSLALKETLKLAENRTVVDLKDALFSAKNSTCLPILKDITKILSAKYGDPMAPASPIFTLAADALKKLKESRVLLPKDYARQCSKVIATVVTPLKHAVDGKHSLLGLGDIVIPGLFVAILHRFDIVVRKVSATRKLVAFPIPNVVRTYFYTAIVFYALGLGATLWGMNKCAEWYPKGNCAQPALLYLVPACMLASFLVALVNGHISTLWAYDEESLGVDDSKTN